MPNPQAATHSNVRIEWEGGFQYMFAEQPKVCEALSFMYTTPAKALLPLNQIRSPLDHGCQRRVEMKLASHFTGAGDNVHAQRKR
ncbi:MAG: hypothetical protein ACR2N1_15650 [Rubripirellula sp.]